ncbi:hypothetical protein ACFSX9_15490 [Flavobacterium ardleyense]|uniref:Uncharacterized protein n=1 Tax=Flavobacterium ardleyense TaxID=2038737 RepID=A0ABW5ZD57_9FLAO
MRNLLLRAIDEQNPVNIYFTVQDNEQNTCRLFYPNFLVTGINDTNNTFIGYSQEERTKNIGQKVITEDSISPICRVEFNED